MDVPRNETPEPERISLSTYHLKTGRLIAVEAVYRSDRFEAYVPARIETDGGQRLATVRCPVSALRGWNSFRHAAFPAGLALDPAYRPGDWPKAVFDAARRGESAVRR